MITVSVRQASIIFDKLADQDPQALIILGWWDKDNFESTITESLQENNIEVTSATTTNLWNTVAEKFDGDMLEWHETRIWESIHEEIIDTASEDFTD